MKVLWEKIREALVSALPITAIVYMMALLPWFSFSGTQILTFSISAIFLVVGIGLFNLGADLAMTPMGTHVGAGLSRQKKLWLLLAVCFSLGTLITDPGALNMGSALAGLTRLLGHKAMTVCMVIANRRAHEANTAYKNSIDDLIVKVLERI